LGSYFASRETYRKWALITAGGGWAILYFTAYAAFRVPATQVISDPMLGFGCLMAVAVGSIWQSLKFKSGSLAFFSYFLAYVSISIVDVSFYSLFASFLLAVSIVIVTRQMGWDALSLFGLAAVYMTHYIWLKPAIYDIGKLPDAATFWFDLLALPWTGEEWRVHPLIDHHRSILHQSFLALYWLLFTTVGFFKPPRQKDQDQSLKSVLLLANSFITFIFTIPISNIISLS
jgi:hypothetical protein